MVAGALYTTDLGIVLALLSNMPDKPHGVPKDIAGRTAKLGHAFYKKTIGTISRIDLYLLEGGRSAIEDVSLRMTRDVPVLKTKIHEGYTLTDAGIEQKFQETLVKPAPERSAKVMLHFADAPEYRENHIPDVHDATWSAAGKLKLKPTNNVTPVEVSDKVYTQIRRAVLYDVLCYYDYKLEQRAEKAAKREEENIEKERIAIQEKIERASSFAFMRTYIGTLENRETNEKKKKKKRKK